MLGMACAPGFAHAVDGVTLIDQNHAITGNVTPGDAPGFPVSINLPGTYKLASNLVVPNASTTAILVNVDNVTIDLNGFAILGPNVCATDGGSVASPCTSASANPFNGVGVDGGSATALLVKNTRVMNGTIDGMGGYGIFLNVNSRVERMNVTQSGNYAIFTSGGVILDTLVRGNGGGGIATTGGIISGSRSLFNRGIGILVSGPGLLSGNIVQANLDVGMSLANSVRYTDNVLYGNVNPAAQQVVGGTQAGANTCIFGACP